MDKGSLLKVFVFSSDLLQEMKIGEEYPLGSVEYTRGIRSSSGIFLEL